MTWRANGSAPIRTYGDIVKTDVLILDLRLVLLDKSRDGHRNVEFVRVRVGILGLPELLDLLDAKLMVRLESSSSAQ